MFEVGRAAAALAALAVALATGVGWVLVNLFWSVIYRRSAKPTKT